MERKVKLTLKQLNGAVDYIGNVEFVEIEEGNGGNIVIYPDGSDEDKFVLDEKGNEL